jgi:hypothetical protein
MIGLSRLASIAGAARITSYDNYTGLRHGFRKIAVASGLPNVEFYRGSRLAASVEQGGSDEDAELHFRTGSSPCRRQPSTCTAGLEGQSRAGATIQARSRQHVRGCRGKGRTASACNSVSGGQKSCPPAYAVGGRQCPPTARSRAGSRESRLRLEIGRSSLRMYSADLEMADLSGPAQFLLPPLPHRPKSVGTAFALHLLSLQSRRLRRVQPMRFEQRKLNGRA